MIFLDDGALGRLREAADAPDLSGTRYRLVRRLARGGMGTIYVVEDAELAREVALKVLSDPDPTGELSGRLLAEACHLARLEHPNIVPVHDAGRLPDGRLFYVMKLIRGRQLDAWSRAGAPLPAVLRLFCRVCEAIAFAHAHGVIHRDLKPENVMVGEFGEAMIMDWGVAKVLGESAEAAGIVLGTPAYMAPEQARGDVEAIDQRTDIYALGAMLQALLAARAAAIPRALQSVCRKAMAQQPEERYGTALELAADVERYLDGFPLVAHRETVLERAGRLLRKNQALALLLAAYLLMRIVMLFAFSR